MVVYEANFKVYIECIRLFYTRVRISNHGSLDQKQWGNELQSLVISHDAEFIFDEITSHTQL
jgi:hypothetical protein